MLFRSINEADIREAIYTTDIDGLDIVSSHIDLVGAEIEMLNMIYAVVLILAMLFNSAPQFVVLRERIAQNFRKKEKEAA